MVNSLRIHIIVSLLFIFACFLLTSCNVAPPNLNELIDLPQPEPTNTPEFARGGLPSLTGNTPDTNPQYMDVAIRCADVRRDACGLLVTLHAIYDDIELDIRLHGDEGVQFLPNLDVLPQDSGDESTIARVKLLRGESRQILFPYLPTVLELPGAYQVIVLATEADTNNLYAYSRTNAYIILNEIGEFHLLPSEIEYNGNFRNLFTEGTLGIGYRIQLEGNERPHRGNLWVRVDGLLDEYEPTVEIISNGAVTFLTDAFWEPQVTNVGMKVHREFPLMNAGGARVAKFPFELDRNGRLLDGEYAFVVNLTESQLTKPQSEKMPVVVQLFSDPQYPTERWLGAHAIPASVATATPNATVVAVDVNNILVVNTGFGGSLKDLDENTANVHCTRLAKASFDANLPRPTWTRLIANYNGTICQAYLNFVAGSVPLSWEDFQRRMVEENDNLTSYEDRLADHRVYILPELDQ